MAYGTGEALILTRLRSLANFNSKNTAQSNWKPMNDGSKGVKAGDSVHFAVLRPGPFSQEWITPTVFDSNWTTLIEVWQRYKDDTTTATDLYARAYEIIAEFMQYPKLGSGDDQYHGVIITGADALQQRWFKEGGPMWLVWELSLQWKEQMEVVNQE